MTRYKNSKIDPVDLTHQYLKKLDWQVNQDANIHYSFPGLMNYAAESIIEQYGLDKLFSSKVSQAHKDGDIYIHDRGKTIVGYCAGWDIRTILKKGFTGVPDKCSAGPAKHLQTALDHIARFILIVSNEWAGAQAVSSLDTFMAPFIEEDRLTFEEVKNCIESFMYNLSISTRYGGQVPFSNITLDWTVPKDLKDEPVIIGGKLQKYTYSDFQKEMDMFNKALIEVYMDGDYAGQPFSFPIPTYNLSEDFDWDDEKSDLLFEMTAKYGNPYFQNFINSDLEPGDVRAMCCRLQMDMTKLIKKTGGRWATGASTGSIGVVDVNLPRIGYEAEGDKEKFLEILKERVLICSEALENKRDAIEEFMQKGLVPYTKEYLGTFDKHFSTIGLVGMNEALLNLWDVDIASKKGRKFALEALELINKTLVEIQKETGNLYNLEASPAESASYYLALKDKEKYPDIITSGNGEPFYTNSTQLPVNYTDDVFEALNLQDELQSTYTGGTVFHVYIGERLTNGQECKKLIKKIAENYKLPYFSITPTFSICEEHGYIKGEAKECPHKNEKGEKCDKPPLVYSRVVGYYRPVKQWNKGKFEEYKSRKEFQVSDNTC
jgi:ribonucleoside-triphosphate reductase